MCQLMEAGSMGVWWGSVTVYGYWVC